MRLLFQPRLLQDLCATPCTIPDLRSFYEVGVQQLEDPCHADPSRHRRLGCGRLKEPWHVDGMKLKRPKSEANWSLHSTGLRLPGRPGTRLPDVGGGGRSDVGHAPLDVHRLAARPQRVRQRRNWAPRAPPPFATFRHIPDRGPRRSNEQLESYGVDLASVIPNDDADGIKDRAGVRELQLAFWRTRRRGVQEWSDLSSACPEARCVSCGSELQFGGACGEVPCTHAGLLPFRIFQAVLVLCPRLRTSGYFSGYGSSNLLAQT